MPPKPSNIRWLILALLFLVTTNNYFDRIMMTTLSTVIMDDLHFGEKEYGYINASFNFLYAVGFLAMGRLVDRSGTKIGYAVSITWWSIAAALHALSRNFLDLAFWRGLLGLGESGNFPSAIKAVTEWFPKRDRALATSLFNSGTNIASVVGPPLFLGMNAVFGWRVCFLITASTGMICLALWWWLFRVPREHPWTNAEEIALIESDNDAAIVEKFTWAQALRMRETYGYALAKFLSDPVWWFYLQWLVPFFKRERNLDLKTIGWALPVIYFSASFGSVLGGWLSGFLIRRGWAAPRARLTAMLLFALCMPFAATAVRAESLWAMVVLVSLATGAHQAWSANIYTTASDFFPKNAVASVTGIGGFMGGIGGVIFASLAPGYLVPAFGYLPIFVMMGVLHPIAWVCAWFFMARRKTAAA